MWVLDVVAGADADTSFCLVAGEWSVGRKHCHFNFHADSSISRSHALFRVGALSATQLGDPASRPELALVDQHSRFGSFVNQQQLLGGQTRRLAHGDLISFGAKRTVLRVRYQVFVLVASRIQRANRARVHDTCQRIGMHLVAAESKYATHCIMDPGRIVATVKVLWALVYNQPVVCTPWIDAILARTSLAEPLPRCEDFLPTDPAVPSMETNYLPNPRRKTLFRGFVVVFLMQQSMQELVEAMDGVVLSAYKDNEQDDDLLCKLETYAGTHQVVVVEPMQGSGFSSTAGQSEQQGEASTSSPLEAIERRVKLFRALGVTFTSVQELAASVIFVKPPTTTSDVDFSSSLASHVSSSSKLLHSPEHASMKSPPSAATAERDDSMRTSKKPGWATSASYEPESTVEHAGSAGIPHEGASVVETQVPPSYDDVQIKDEALEDTSTTPLSVKSELGPPPGAVLPMSLNTDQRGANATATLVPTTSPGKLEYQETESFGWVSARHLQAREARGLTKDEEPNKPPVVVCDLVVKTRQSRPSSESQDSNADGLVNYKRFKKGNGFSSARPAASSLFPTPMVVSVTVDNADREAMQEDLEGLEEQERIAEELFAMVEGRASRRPF